MRYRSESRSQRGPDYARPVSGGRLPVSGGRRPHPRLAKTGYAAVTFLTVVVARRMSR